MKKVFLCMLLALFLTPFVFFSHASASEKIVIGVTPFPHKDIVLVAKPLLEAKGYTVVIKEFTDYVQPNIALSNKLLFANFFQHKPYLDNMNAKNDLHLVSIAAIHIEPLGMYSKKIKKLSDLKKGNSISVPNDPTNEARALRLLEANGVIQCKAGELITVADIVKNPLNLKFYELEAAQLPRTLDDVTLSVVNTNFAVEAGFLPTKDALAIERKDSPFANIVVVREEDAKSKKAMDLLQAMQSKEVKTFIEKELVSKGIVPAF